MRKKRIEITVETDQVVIIRKTQRLSRAWCQDCGELVKLVTAEAAAVASGVSPRTIYRWVEAGKIHFTEQPGGSLLICLNSLTAVTSDE